MVETKGTINPSFRSISLLETVGALAGRASSAATLASICPRRGARNRSIVRPDRSDTAVSSGSACRQDEARLSLQFSGAR